MDSRAPGDASRGGSSGAGDRSARFDTALREYVHTKILEIAPADLVIGVPTYNSEATVAHVVRTIADGASRHYPSFKTVILVSDGGSLDYTREVVQKLKLPAGVVKIVFIYRGLPGKGTSLRAIFEAALRLRAKACAVFDSDLRSITPDWVKAMVDPVLSGGYDFVSPFYRRHKYDGTITNNVAYSLTRALYGKRVRQPIGGDFGFSPVLADLLTKQYVWETDAARFGIDIWMTTVALCEGFRMCEAHLGVKIHDAKDPATSLGPMFSQVVGTIFELMGRYRDVWTRVRGSEPVPLLGEPRAEEPSAVRIDVDRLLGAYRRGVDHFGPIWKEVMAPATYEGWRTADASIVMPPGLWVRTVYDFAAAYLRWQENRGALLDMMVPLYYRRIASFVEETRDMTTADAEREVVERNALMFEEEKPYLLERCGLRTG